ncbi:hypothetical protein B0H63DRAFT_418148 [Podospora didyma]|uniref:Uncharacterized protein n=1 Tax=Podospora didyma TaxID=330526 RepID=A0AAE0KKC5_9PEZI|nr:hypothetical protein B0H63DRAFT_418148 [Podospora didyma]
MQPKTVGWKPHTMRAPVLVAVIVLTLALAAAVEVISQKSQRQGGLSLSNSIDEIPLASKFAYLYATTIIAVVYSIVWTWVDLDIRRMQPWLELSRPGGAVADSSILLDYPFTFLAFIPFSAGRRRHWPVLLVGLASMVVFWGITPLSSAIFGLQSVNVEVDMAMAVPSTLASPQEQSINTDTTILYAAYGSTGLGQLLPPFTSPKFGIVPFSPMDTTRAHLPNESWTSPTTMLSTELNCWPAAITNLTHLEGSTPAAPSYKFSNGRGCETTPFGFFQSSKQHNTTSMLLYVGYDDHATLDYHLGGTNCPKSSRNQFLAIWALLDKNRYPHETAMTALFCEPSYWKQNVSITVSAAINEPDEQSVVILGPKERLSQDEFNSTALEYLIGTGTPPATATLDYAATQTLEPFFTLLKTQNVAWPVTNMVSFALHLMDVPAASLQNASMLAKAFELAHKLVFSIAVAKSMSTSSDYMDNPTKLGKVQGTVYGIVVSRAISAVLEGLLLLVALLGAAVLYVCLTAESKLSSDPAAMGFTLSLLKSSRTLLSRFATEDCSDTATLRASLAGHRFALHEGCPGELQEVNALQYEVENHETRNSPATMHRQEPLYSPVQQCSRHNTYKGHELETLQVESAAPSASGLGKSTPRKEPEYFPVQPLELKPLTGVSLTLLLLGGVSALTYLKKQEEKLHGLPRPTDNFEIMQLLENYIPTVLATLLEPLLVLLTRLSCILQPFHDLQKGKCSPEDTLEARYTSLPPQLVTLRALLSRHLLMAALGLICILSNALTVALGGTFNELPVDIDYPAIFRQERNTNFTRDQFVESSISSNQYKDQWYAEWARLTRNTSLPPWVSADFAFLPVTETVPRQGDKVVMRTRTRGFGADPKCSPISTTTSSTHSFVDISGILKHKANPAFNFPSQNGTSIACTAFFVGNNATNDRSALEITGSMAGANASRSLFCLDKLALGWVRLDSRRSAPDSLQSTIIICETVMRTAMFDVLFDATGKVVEFSQAGEFEDMSRYIAANVSRDMIQQMNRYMATSVDTQWHNITNTHDWFNFILKYRLNTDLVDPAKDIPSYDLVIPAAQDLYKSLFAILLGQNLDLFELSNLITFPGVVTERETRIFLDETSLIVTIGILCLTAVVLVALYVRERRAFLPRLPSTIASVIAYVAAGRATREYARQENGKGKTDKPTELLRTYRQTYSFGRYIGVDGKLHVGIEVDPLVMPVDGTMLQKKQTGLGLVKRTPWFR